jgi:hypothetical protein
MTGQNPTRFDLQLITYPAGAWIKLKQHKVISCNVK